MISLPLKFDEVESVEEFVNMVKRLDYDVDVKIGRCVFDAKSLMSVLMIAGNPDAVVEAHTNDIEAFKKKFFLRVQHLQRVYRKEASRPMMRNSECAGLPVIWKILEAEKRLKVKRI